MLHEFPYPYYLLHHRAKTVTYVRHIIIFVYTIVRILLNNYFWSILCRQACKTIAELLKTNVRYVFKRKKTFL